MPESNGARIKVLEYLYGRSTLAKRRKETFLNHPETQTEKASTPLLSCSRDNRIFFRFAAELFILDTCINYCSRRSVT